MTKTKKLPPVWAPLPKKSTAKLIKKKGPKTLKGPKKVTTAKSTPTPKPVLTLYTKDDLFVIEGSTYRLQKIGKKSGGRGPKFQYEPGDKLKTSLHITRKFAKKVDKYRKTIHPGMSRSCFIMMAIKEAMQ